VHNQKLTRKSPYLTTEFFFFEQVAEPSDVLKLMETHIDQPNFLEHDPFVVIEASGTFHVLHLSFINLN
jgi:hypothetical protein